MANDCRLTTFDNPFDPFDDFASWNLFDVEHGYNTCCYLARIGNWTDDMTQQEELEETERAIDEIIFHDFLNIYKKVYRKQNQNDVVQSEDNTNNSE